MRRCLQSRHLWVLGSVSKLLLDNLSNLQRGLRKDWELSHVETCVSTSTVEDLGRGTASCLIQRMHWVLQLRLLSSLQQEELNPLPAQ